MKKLNYLLLGLAGLTMASCSQEDIQAPGAGDGNYNVTVKLPADIGTRAVNMNTGLTATQLRFAVYDKTDNSLVMEGNGEFAPDQLETTVSMNLANGKEYYISFFADAPGNDVYTFDARNATMSVDYTRMTSAGTNENDSYDCFINLLETPEIGSEVVNTSIILYRPVAQINWGANDLMEAAIQNYFGKPANGKPMPYMQATLTTEAFYEFNLLENDVNPDKTTDVELVDFTQPLQANGNVAAFPVSGYTYVGMQYLLAPKAESAVYDLSLDINNGNVPENSTGASTSHNYVVGVANAPVQANYRTNIYGSLLTDNLVINVVKSPYWEGGYDLPQGDMGDEVEGSNGGLFFNPSLLTYTITTVDGLNKFSEISNAGGDTALNGYTVLLGDDIDMAGVTNYTPINNAGAVFDGQGHTISNLTVTATGEASAGFMSTARGTVRNINFTDANVSGNFKVGVLAGDGLCANISGISVNGATITSTPHLVDGTYDDGNNVGGIVGYLSAEPQASVTGCSVENATITAYRKVGGIVGFANGGAVVQHNNVSDTKITANQKLASGSYVKPYPFQAGEIAGGWDDAAKVYDNVPTNVSVTCIGAEGQYVVSNLESLQDLVDQLKAIGLGAINNKTISLQEGTVLDFGGAEIEPLDFFNSGDFGCTFDGNGVVIKNFTVTGTGNYFGFIKNFSGTIKNITVENMTVKGNGVNVGMVGYLRGTMENVVVRNSNISSTGGGVGALVGVTNGNCAVKDSQSIGNTVTGGYRAGGIVGYTNEGTTNISGCAVENGNISVTLTSMKNTAGTVVGQALGTCNISSTTVTGTMVNGEENNTVGNN